MTTLPKISIVTPSYNQGKYLEKTILSVLEQGYPNLEYIIIDGGSTDESVEIIRKYQDRLTYWESEPDRGQCHAINKGFEKATGEIYGWLNSDDWYHPGALQTVAEAFAANPDAGAVVGAGDLTDGDATLAMPSFQVSCSALYGWIDRFFMQPSCFFSRQAWQACGPLDEKLDFAMDLDLWIKIAKGFSYVTTEANLSASLVHSQAKTTALAGASVFDAAKVIARHGGQEQLLQLTGKIIEDLFEKKRTLAEQQQQIAQLDVQLLAQDYKIAELERWLGERDAVLYVRDSEIGELKHTVYMQELTITGLHNSLSWKLTRPLRWVLEQLTKGRS